jgi:branched-subunit amino acid transport protein
MTTPVIVIVCCAVGTLALKATGPILLGGRTLPARVDAVVRLAGPALLAALVATSTFTSDGSLTVDARVIGLGVAAVAIRFHAPALLVVVLAAAATALVRIAT